MKAITLITARNLTLFRKNRTNVLLCFFAILIVYSLYFVFLRDFMIKSVMSSGLPQDKINEFTDLLMISGLLIVVNTTSCFGIMQQCIHDTQSGIKRDFLIAPIKKSGILFGYWLTSIVVSCIYTTIAFIGIQIYFRVSYQFTLSLRQLVLTFGLIFISSILNSELLFCFIAYMKDTTTFSTFGNLYGMLAGFLAGTYLPYELYPDRLKRLLIYYPPTHLTSFMRQIFFLGYPEHEKQEQLYDLLYELYGVRLNYQNAICTMEQQWLILGLSFACMLLFLGMVHHE